MTTQPPKPRKPPIAKLFSGVDVSEPYGIASMTTYQIDLPPLPDHIAKDWKVKRVGRPTTGDHFVCATGDYVTLCNHKGSFGCFELRIILERITPPFVPPDWLVRSGFWQLKWNIPTNSWKLVHKDGAFYDAAHLFPNLELPTDKNEVYRWDSK